MHRLALALCLIPGLASAALEVVDDAGATLRLERPAGRIVSLAPHLTELAFAAGAGAHLVGVVRDSDYPPEARAIAQVGDAAGADYERILALQPELVLAWGSGNRRVVVERLRALGLPVLVLEPRRLADIARHVRLIGAAAGTGRQAQSVATAFERRVEVLRAAHRGAEPVGVMFELWHRPVMTVNGEHLISDVLRLCGGRNVFADLPHLAGEVSMEQVFARDPEVIVVGSEAAGVEDWKGFPSLGAVAGGHVYAVSADLITRQTPRTLDAVEAICAALGEYRSRRR
ncbi:MAG TPA: cobalamin-binding protein [Burkholderiales bacterium]|nr:cobalamin-binding protein [Burkholderiales bacterium]